MACQPARGTPSLAPGPCIMGEVTLSPAPFPQSQAPYQHLRFAQNSLGWLAALVGPLQPAEGATPYKDGYKSVCWGGGCPSGA